MPRWAGARCLLPTLVARGAAVPTLTSSGTMLTAAAPATHNRHQVTHTPNLLLAKLGYWQEHTSGPTSVGPVVRAGAKGVGARQVNS